MQISGWARRQTFPSPRWLASPELCLHLAPEPGWTFPLIPFPTSLLGTNLPYPPPSLIFFWILFLRSAYFLRFSFSKVPCRGTLPFAKFLLLRFAGHGFRTKSLPPSGLPLFTEFLHCLRCCRGSGALYLCLGVRLHSHLPPGFFRAFLFPFASSPRDQASYAAAYDP